MITIGRSDAEIAVDVEVLHSSPSGLPDLAFAPFHCGATVVGPLLNGVGAMDPLAASDYPDQVRCPLG
jgi:hypothetical protein